MKTITLLDGHVMPALGLGTWKSADDAAYRAVKEALRVGYRHLDAAWIYQNEDRVGAAVRESIDEGVVGRDELFVTSKLWNAFHRPEHVERGCRQSLEALGLETLDLFLMHWPMAFREGVVFPEGQGDFESLSDVPLAETWAAMVALVDAGLVRSVGVSNFGPERLAALLASTDRPPVMNQVELHPYHPQADLLALCSAHGIRLTGYAPLGSGDRPARLKLAGEPPVLENAVVRAVAEEEGCTPAQVLLAWALARGTAVIPKSTNPGRIAENLAAAALTLSASSLARLDAIETRYRYVDPVGWMHPGITHAEGSSFWA